MKTKLMLSLVLVLASLSAKAGNDNDSRARVDLVTFRNIISISYDSINKDANDMRDRAYYYNNLNYVQYGKRYQVIKENCKATKEIAVNLVMLGAAVEATENTLKTAPVLQTAEAETRLNNLHIYIKSIKAADDVCGSPTKSLIELRKGIAALGDVKAFLDSIPLD